LRSEKGILDGVVVASTGIHPGSSPRSAYCGGAGSAREKN
jgi:hypothetical protein